MYPCIKINIKNINNNIKKVKDLCKKNNIKLNIVLKVLSGNYDIVKKLNLKYVDSISDSRIENLKLYKDINKEKWLIRIPSFSEIKDTIKYSDVSFNSSLDTIILLNNEAKKQKKVHKVILMYELGDLREGADYSYLSMISSEVVKLSNIELYGIGANLTCYGGIAPSIDNTEEIFDVKNALEYENEIKFNIVSGANSSSYKLLEDGTLTNKMNYVRFGESIFLGMIPGYYEEIKDLNQDNFILETQIVEIFEKPSVPKGEILKNSFGEEVSFEDNGYRIKALVNIGKQDTGLNMKPLDKDIKILDGSSDYLILDLTDCKNEYKLGDIIKFIPDYESLLKIMTSSYVKKDITK